MSDSAPATASPAKPAPNRKRLRLIAGGVILVAILAAAGWYALHAGIQSTDDAQIEADVIAVPSRVGGVVTKVDFDENQMVTAGAVLAEIDPVQYQAKLAAAEADLASAKAAADSAEANVSREIVSARAALTAASSARDTAQADLTRAKNLFGEHAISQQRLDTAQAQFDAADSNLAQARARLQAALASTTGDSGSSISHQAGHEAGTGVQAQIAQAEARVAAAQAARDLAATELSWTKITAPADGMASKKSVVAGQMVGPGQPIVMLVPTHVWVVANFKETQLAKIKPGQRAEITVDAYPGLKLHGKIESLSGATGARFSLLPAENATGNFTKVVQRVPVKIALDELPKDQVLRAGMSADVTVDVRR
jgi:membrane fusion protein (multidrug efflux system)